MSEVPLFVAGVLLVAQVSLRNPAAAIVQVYLAREKTPTTPGPPYDPRHSPTVGSQGVAFSCRSTHTKRVQRARQCGAWCVIHERQLYSSIPTNVQGYLLHEKPHPPRTLCRPTPRTLCYSWRGGFVL